MEELKPNDVEENAGFTSTTSDVNWAQGFANECHYPKTLSGDKISLTEVQYVPVMYTMHMERAKDIRPLNPDESELLLLPNTKFRVKTIQKRTNMPFADFKPEKVAEWLLAFGPQPTSTDTSAPPATLLYQSSGEHIINAGITGNMILETFSVAGFEGVAKLICEDDLRFKEFREYEADFDYTHVKGLSATLFEGLVTGKSTGKGKFHGMFNQKYFFCQKGQRNRPLGPSKVGHYYRVELEEVTDDSR